MLLKRKVSLIDPNALTTHMTLTALASDFRRIHVLCARTVGISDGDIILLPSIGELGQIICGLIKVSTLIGRKLFDRSPRIRT